MKLLKVLFLSLLIANIFSPAAHADELVLQPGAEGKDAEITTSFPDTPHPNYLILVSNYAGTDHGMIEFNISSLPAGATINNAALELQEYGNCHVNLNLMELHLNQGSWNEASITWNNAPSYGPAIATNTGDTTGCEWHFFNVTSAVADWHSGAASNYGFRLTGPTNGDVVKFYHSSDYNDVPAFRPILRINYTPREGQGIPTLSEGGMIFMSLLLAGTAIWMIRRRRTA